MQYLSLDPYRHVLLLIARALLVVLFIIFGWEKITDFQETIGYMLKVGAPLPNFAAVIAVVAELGFGIALLIGYFTRPLALFMALYTIATGVIGHPFWNMEGIAAYQATINFYKNISIAGGFLLLAVTGPGKFSLDKK